MSKRNRITTRAQKMNIEQSSINSLKLCSPAPDFHHIHQSPPSSRKAATILVFAIFLITLLLPAHGICSPFHDSDLIGKWTATGNLGTETLTYSADHTITSAFAGVLASTASGTWKLDGNQILLKWKSNPLDPAIVGKVTRETIVKLHHNILVTTVPGYMTTYKRRN